MSDDEAEMAKMRQSNRFQTSLANQSKSNKDSQQETPSEPKKSPLDVLTKLHYQRDQSDNFKAPQPKSQQQKQVTQQALLNQQMERREQIMKDKRIFVDKQQVDGDEDGFSISDLSDINVVKMSKYSDNSNTFPFLDDDEQSNTNSAEHISKYKDHLMNEYYEDLKRKQKLTEQGEQGDQAYLPQDLGRQKKKKNLTEDEIESIHSQHKRVKLSTSVKNKNEFEVNVEEDDDDMVGPKLDLFEKHDQMEVDEDRKRKVNQIYQNVEGINDGGDDVVDKYQLPISHEVVLDGHLKSIQTIDIDASGTKMITGGLDFVLKMWDLSTMNRKLKPSREFKPFDGHPVRSLSFSPNGQFFLCCCGNSQAKIHSRDGQKLQMTIRGDMYIQDMANTKGHVASLTDGRWHPKLNNVFMTSSLDCSIRIWDIESKLMGVDQQLMHESVIKTKDARGQKVAINSCNYSPKGTLIIGGCYDGSVQLWEAKSRNFHRPQILLQTAHASGSEVSCVKMFKDEKRLVTRSMDDTMKLWDIRNTKVPVQEWKGLTNLSSKTNIAISPDEKFVLTGTSVRKGFGYGHVMAYDVQTGDLVEQVPISQQSVITVLWHRGINQIAVGSADTNIHFLYDPKLSDKGIMSCIVKQEKRKQIDSATIFQKPIYNPSTYEDEREKEMEKDPFNPNNQNAPSCHIAPEVLDPRLLKDKIRNDPILTKKPDQPLQGPLGRGGRVSQSGTLTQYIMQNLNKNDQRNMDAREALLKHAKAAEEDPQWVGPAYRNTQPKTLFDNSVIKREGLKFLEETTKEKCTRCGLKFCTCSTSAKK